MYILNCAAFCLFSGISDTLWHRCKSTDLMYTTKVKNSCFNSTDIRDPAAHVCIIHLCALSIYGCSEQTDTSDTLTTTTFVRSLALSEEGIKSLTCHKCQVKINRRGTTVPCWDTLNVALFLVTLHAETCPWTLRGLS